MLDPTIALTKLFESVLEKLGSEVSKLGFSGGGKLIETLRLNFSEYLSSAIDRASRVKTLLNRDEPVNSMSIYVKTFLKSGGTIISDEKLIERARKSASFVVVGSAGCGKSMFMRYLFLSMIENTFGRIPILIELRHLNAFEPMDLTQFIYDTIVRPGAIITNDQFRHCLRSNLFTLILDGLDEIDFRHRPTIERQIMNLNETYPKMGIIVSSSP